MRVMFSFMDSMQKKLTLNVRRQPAGVTDDTTDAIPAVVCIRFVDRVRFAQALRYAVEWG